MKRGEVVSVVAVSGEYVGKFNHMKDEVLYIDDPRMLIAGEQGVGFARGVCMTGAENPNSMAFQQFVYVTRTSEEFEKAYRQATSGLII